MLSPWRPRTLAPTASFAISVAACRGRVIIGDGPAPTAWNTKAAGTTLAG
jgi:hypothetical protein